MPLHLVSMSLVLNLFCSLCSMWTLNQPLLFCSKPISRASSLLQWRTSLRVVKQVCFKRQLRPSFHQGDFFFLIIIILFKIVMKIAPSSLLADVMDMRSGSRQPTPGICMSFVAASQGKHSGRSSRTYGRSSGRSNNKAGCETRSVHINSLPLQHNESSEAPLDQQWSVCGKAQRAGLEHQTPGL